MTIAWQIMGAVWTSSSMRMVPSLASTVAKKAKKEVEMTALGLPVLPMWLLPWNKWRRFPKGFSPPPVLEKRISLWIAGGRGGEHRVNHLTQAKNQRINVLRMEIVIGGIYPLFTG